MKVVIHHLPTGCSWTVNVKDDLSNSTVEVLSQGNGMGIQDMDTKTKLIFPPKVLSESVVRFEE